MYYSKDLRIKRSIGRVLCFLLFLFVFLPKAVGGTPSLQKTHKEKKGGDNIWLKTSGSPGGNVLALAVHPERSDTVYVGTTNGIFMTIDGGDNWEEVNSGLAEMEVLTLAINPIVPDTIYAGTRRGLFVTLDGGINWKDMGDGMINGIVRAIAIHPNTPDILYVGSEKYLLMTTDGGISWKKIKSGYAIESLAISPGQPEIIYAATFGNGIFKTKDRGATWQEVNNGLPKGVGATPVTPIKHLVIAPDDVETVYVGTEVDGIFKTVDGGENWLGVVNGLPVPFTRRTYPVVLAISQQNSDVLYAGISNPVHSELIDHTIYRTEDGGKTWTEVREGLPNTYPITSLSIYSNGHTVIYAVTRDGMFELTQ